MELKRGGGAISFPTNSTGASSARQREGKEEEERGKNKKRRDTAFPNRGSKVLKICTGFFTFERETGDEILYTPPRQLSFSFFFCSGYVASKAYVRTHVEKSVLSVISSSEFRRIFFLPPPPSTNFISSLSHRLKRAFNYYNEIYPRAG